MVCHHYSTSRAASDICTGISVSASYPLTPLEVEVLKEDVASGSSVHQKAWKLIQKLRSQRRQELEDGNPFLTELHRLGFGQRPTDSKFEHTTPARQPTPGIGPAPNSEDAPRPKRSRPAITPRANPAPSLQNNDIDDDGYIPGPDLDLDDEPRPKRSRPAVAAQSDPPVPDDDSDEFVDIGDVLDDDEPSGDHTSDEDHWSKGNRRKQNMKKAQNARERRKKRKEAEAEAEAALDVVQDSEESASDEDYWAKDKPMDPKTKRQRRTDEAHQARQAIQAVYKNPTRPTTGCYLAASKTPFFDDFCHVQTLMFAVELGYRPTDPNSKSKLADFMLRKVDGCYYRTSGQKIICPVLPRVCPSCEGLHDGFDSRIILLHGIGRLTTEIWEQINTDATNRRSWNLSHLCHNSLCQMPAHIALETPTKNNCRDSHNLMAIDRHLKEGASRGVFICDHDDPDGTWSDPHKCKPFTYQELYVKDPKKIYNDYGNQILAFGKDFTVCPCCNKNAPTDHPWPGFYMFIHLVLAHTDRYPAITNQELSKLSLKCMYQGCKSEFSDMSSLDKHYKSRHIRNIVVRGKDLKSPRDMLDLELFGPQIFNHPQWSNGIMWISAQKRNLPRVLKQLNRPKPDQYHLFQDLFNITESLARKDKLDKGRDGSIRRKA